MHHNVVTGEHPTNLCLKVNGHTDKREYSQNKRPRSVRHVFHSGIYSRVEVSVVLYTRQNVLTWS